MGLRLVVVCVEMHGCIARRFGHEMDAEQAGLLTEGRNIVYTMYDVQARGRDQRQLTTSYVGRHLDNRPPHIL